MIPAPDTASYRMLEGNGLAAYLAGLEHVRAVLGGGARDWRIREVGDGNLNVVFIVEGPSGAVCVKQAVPYVRVAGPSWPMALQRAFFETAYYRAVAPHAGALVPAIHHYDPELYCTIMERLAPHIILRHGLIAGRRYPRLGRDLGEFVARASFFTSDLAQPFEQRMQDMALFAGNQPLIRISVDLIFKEPYVICDRNRHTAPQLDALAAELRRDARLKLAVSRLGHRFLTCTQALLHGDLHSGSVMVSDDDTRIIDPEFAFYGPIGFDLGAFFGNLLLSWYSQPGHASNGDDRTRYQAWILEQAGLFWTTFKDRFLALWSAHGCGDAYPAALFGTPEESALLEKERRAFVDRLFEDMLGFAACKMIRRILGFAHVLDFEGIADAQLRARCESAALRLARRLLVHPEEFSSLGAVFDAVAAPP